MLLFPTRANFPEMQGCSDVENAPGIKIASVANLRTGITCSPPLDKIPDLF